jgi:hypothetical protein
MRPMPPSSPYDPWPARGDALADVVQALASASIRLTTLPVSRGFTAVRTGSRLRFLVQQRAECVFVAVFKFARFDRLHRRDAMRGQSPNSQ